MISVKIQTKIYCPGFYNSNEASGSRRFDNNQDALLKYRNELIRIVEGTPKDGEENNEEASLTKNINNMSSVDTKKFKEFYEFIRNEVESSKADDTLASGMLKQVRNSIRNIYKELVALKHNSLKTQFENRKKDERREKYLVQQIKDLFEQLQNLEVGQKDKGREDTNGMKTEFWLHKLQGQKQR